ncbi:MAG: hypothetical protein Q9190_002117 [Brigantiaea leucoxantha]
MPGQSSGHTPRSSTSSHSRPSPTPSQTDSTLADRDNLVTSNTSDAASQKSPYDQAQRRHRARRSGGFLLESVVPPNQRQQIPKHSLDDTIRDTKGKQKAESTDLPIPKRRSARQSHQAKHAIGGSPLSIVVNSSNPGHVPQGNSGNDPDEILTVPSNFLSQRNTSLNGVVTQHRQESPSPLGYNTDPAQIVNLALNLSESRRRNFSASRLSPGYQLPQRRFASSGPSNAGPQGSYMSAAGLSLKEYLQDQRRISRSGSLKSSNNSHQRAPSPLPDDHSQDSAPSTLAALSDPGLPDAITFKPSDATLARAEKARVALELSYEYRRLLQFLPKLPKSPSSRLGTASSNSKEVCKHEETHGRAYNPLQYIRNRRARRREIQKSLDEEAEKWKDLDRVRLWIDTVASDRAPDVSKRQTPLPSFESVQLDSTQVEPSPDFNISRWSGLPSSKSRQGGMYWMVTPWQLFVDTCWLDQRENLSTVDQANATKLGSNGATGELSTPRTSLERSEPPGKRSLSLARQITSENSAITESQENGLSGKEQSRTRREDSEHKSPIRSQDEPRDRKSKWRRTFIRSRSYSSLDYSDTEEPDGLAQGDYHGRDRFNSAALKKEMREMLEKEVDGDVFGATDGKPIREDNQKAIAKRVVKPRSGDANGKTLSGHDKTLNKLKSPFTKSHQSPRTSLEEQRGRTFRTSFEETSDATPKSPNVFNFGPSIFVNKSAPNSRSVSPKKPLPTRLGSFRRHRSHSRAISENDFAIRTKSPARDKRNAKTEIESDVPSNADVRFSASSKNLLSPATAESFGKRFRRVENSSASIKSSKESRDSDSRLRGLFKGGRIAELVGHEVSRVGDMIWRRDGSSSQVNSPTSVTGSAFSDTEDDASGLEYSPEDGLSRVTTKTDDGGKLSRMSTRNGQPRYHIPNLPNFRSANAPQPPGSPKFSPEDDHISRQQKAQKAQGRSSRWNRLAPPKIDMRNVSPSASPPLSRVQTRDSQISYNNSRATSTSRSGDRIRDADRRLNDVLGMPGHVRNGPPALGLAHIDHSQHRSRSRPAEGQRQWSISDRSVSNVRGTVSKRDIARVRALLLSSGIKANEIVRRSREITDPPFLLQLRELQRRSQGPLAQVPRRQEHLLVAKLLVGEIDSANQQLRDAAETFSTSKVDELHDQIRAIDERVTHKLTPQVRTSADDADGLSLELTTTHTLAVKRLNDSVDLILRRRRRRFRWLRRGGFALLEWILLGIMWWVWFMVVIFQFVRGTARATVVAVRWFFWL